MPRNWNSDTFLVGMHYSTTIWKAVWKLSKTESYPMSQQFHNKMYIPKRTENISHKILYTKVHSYIIHNRQKRKGSNSNVYQLILSEVSQTEEKYLMIALTYGI